MNLSAYSSLGYPSQVLSSDSNELLEVSEAYRIVVASVDVAHLLADLLVVEVTASGSVEAGELHNVEVAVAVLVVLLEQSADVVVHVVGSRGRVGHHVAGAHRRGSVGVSVAGSDRGSVVDVLFGSVDGRLVVGHVVVCFK